MEQGDGIGEQGIVTVGCFYEDLCFVFMAGAGFQGFQAALASVVVGGQVAFEGETLPVCAGCH